MGSKFEHTGRMIQTGMMIAGAVVAAVAVDSIKTAASMETAMTRLTTTAGESASNINMVQSGIDSMAGKVGFTVTELADAMYYVESGGYHGAKGLEVLDAAAKAARIEGANATDVAHALTGALNDYRGTNLSAATAANTMTTAVGHGMMTFQDFAEALPKIGARASSAHVSFQELTAALATMTQDGLPASVAATYLGQTIGQLAAPSAKARTEMKGLGIDATALAQTITSGSGHGLGDAIKMLYDGINKHLSPAGLVAVETFKKSSGSATDYQKMLANLPPTMQTTVQALATMSGGVKGFQGVLMLGGRNADAYSKNLAAMNDTVKKGGKDIAGFADQQKTLNGKIHDAEGAWSSLKDQLGNALLPTVKDLLDKLTQLVDWATKNQDAVKQWMGAIMALAGAMVLIKGSIIAWRVAQLLLLADTKLMTAWMGLLDAAVALSRTTFGTWVGVMALQGIGALRGVITAVREWTAVQWLLNLAMDANPIGLVIIAIGLLVAAVVVISTHWDRFCSLLTASANQAALWVVEAFHFMVGMILEVFGAIIHGAAFAFGWVPGLGPKLQQAAGWFDGFKDNVNTSLDAIQTKLQVNIDTAQARANVEALHSDFVNQVWTVQAKVQGQGTVLLPGHASGGFVQAGVPTIVGENHPEVFIPQTDGYISPHRPSGDMGGMQKSGPVVNIEHYHEGSKSVAQIGAELMFRARFT
jgi:TP901 family phage tail tape measure protein